MSTSTDSSNAVQQLFEQAARMFQTALEAGIKVQEESSKSFANMVGGMSSPQEWQQRAQAVLGQTLTTAQQNVEDAIRVMNENTKVGMELLSKALDARQTQSGPDVQAKTKEMWETAIGAVRRNSEMLVQVNSRLVESWQDLTKIFSSNGAKTS